MGARVGQPLCFTAATATVGNGGQTIKLAHLKAIAAALHRSPAAFLADTDEAAAAIVEQIVDGQEQ